MRKPEPNQETTPMRKRLPDERKSITKTLNLGIEIEITVGLYEDGTPGELWVSMAKEGSTLSGVFDAFSIAVSLALQHGVPVHALVDKYRDVRFEPSGHTGDKDIPFAHSIVDFIAKWLELKFPRTVALVPAPAEAAPTKPKRVRSSRKKAA
jgi:ribonucleoside-diphosphate reductase alpha chain